MVRFVGDRPFDDKNERVERAFGGTVEIREEVVPDLVGQERIANVHLRDPGDAAEHEILEARLGRGRHRDGDAVTGQTRRHPEDVDLRDGARDIAGPSFEWSARHTCSIPG